MGGGGGGPPGRGPAVGGLSGTLPLFRCPCQVKESAWARPLNNLNRIIGKNVNTGTGSMAGRQVHGDATQAQPFGKYSPKCPAAADHEYAHVPPPFAMRWALAIAVNV